MQLFLFVRTLNFLIKLVIWCPFGKAVWRFATRARHPITLSGSRSFGSNVCARPREDRMQNLRKGNLKTLWRLAFRGLEGPRPGTVRLHLKKESDSDQSCVFLQGCNTLNYRKVQNDNKGLGFARLSA